jgi:hypothetical protein
VKWFSVGKGGFSLFNTTTDVRDKMFNIVLRSRPIEPFPREVENKYKQRKEEKLRRR